MLTVDRLESLRVDVQSKLDASKTHSQRNKLGQFATPNDLAVEILKYARSILLDTNKVSFLDPAFGTGSFYSAFLRVFPNSSIQQAWGYEIDKQIVDEAMDIWKDTPLKLFNKDFTKTIPPTLEEEKINLLICNPPYVRHHHLTVEDKMRLKETVNQIGEINLSGLSGLYCYYICLSHQWMAKNGLACWLIPSEYMDVNYGQQLKKYLLNYVTVIHIHRFDPKDVQFDDALVSSAVVFFINSKPENDYNIKFSYGGTLLSPNESKEIPSSVLKQSKKWSKFPKSFNTMMDIDNRFETKLSDLFTIKRGLATGNNEFFIFNEDKINKYDINPKFLIPILPSPRFLKRSVIEPDENGHPSGEEKLFLLSCNLPEEKVQEKYPSLMSYFKMGIQKGVDKGYLCNHRVPWYSQELRLPPKYLCTYMGRQNLKSGKQFRFILNNTDAIATNSYLLLYPKPILENKFRENPKLVKLVWDALNNINQESLISEGRVYGGGLYKIEPKELNNVSGKSIVDSLNIKISKQTTIKY
jgi:adenine-specific DNA-methyltransferase